MEKLLEDSEFLTFHLKIRFVHLEFIVSFTTRYVHKKTKLVLKKVHGCGHDISETYNQLTLRCNGCKTYIRDPKFFQTQRIVKPIV